MYVPYPAIALSIDASPFATWKAATRSIRPPKRGYQFSEATIEEWAERYASGESLESIAFSAGLKSSEPVRRRLVDAGVEIRDKVSTTSSSWQEWAIYFYLRKAYPEHDVANNRRVDTRQGARFPDVSVVGNGLKLAIEYDGEFWHNTKEHRVADERKTKLLEQEGFQVVRVIENSRGENRREGSVILCTAERKGTETGIGYAINALLDMLCIKGVQVDLEQDTQEISTLYYQAKNRTSHGLEWAKLYEGGVSTNAIADQYGVSSTTVSNALKSLGIDIRHVPTDEDEIALWLDMFESGKRVHEIADARGVNKTTVYRALKKAGVQFDPHATRAITAWDEQWKTLYIEEHQSLSQIAKQYGVCAETVRAHLRKMGVDTTKRR